MEETHPASLTQLPSSWAKLSSCTKRLISLSRTQALYATAGLGQLPCCMCYRWDLQAARWSQMLGIYIYVFFWMPGQETWQQRIIWKKCILCTGACLISGFWAFFYSLLSICREFCVMKWRDVDFTARGDYFQVRHQKEVLVAYGAAGQCSLHWGPKWSFLDYTPHCSGAESTYSSGWVLDGAALCLCHPCLPASAPWQRTWPSHSPWGSVWKLWCLVLSQAPFTPVTRVGPALRVLHEMFFPAHAVAEPEESPFPLHFKPDGDYSLPSAQFAMPSAKSCSRCRKTITVLQAHVWHLQRSHAALTSHKAFQACTSSTCRNPLQGRNAPLFWFLLQHG